MIKRINLYLESYGISNFLIYKLANSSDIAIQEIHSLRNSPIPGLLPCVALERDENFFIRYDLVSRKNLKKEFAQRVTKEQLFKTLLHITETFIYAENQGLKVENFVLDPNYIYQDHFSGRPLFVYLPIENNHFEKIPLKDFFLNLMNIAPYDEEDDLRFFIKTHNYLVGSEEVNLVEFKEKLSLFAKANGKKASQTNQHEKFYRPGAGVVDSEGMVTSQYSSAKIDKKQGPKLEIEEEVQYKRITRTEIGEKDKILAGATKINIVPGLGSPASIEMENNEAEGTTVLGASYDIDEDEGTTALGVADFTAPRPFILAMASNEKIVISSDVFKIGRDPNLTDYTTDNKVVGRVHAQVIAENGEYFLEDYHSTNGSYVNSKKLAKGERVKIKHDDEIKFANEEFLFKLF